MASGGCQSPDDSRINSRIAESQNRNQGTDVPRSPELQHVRAVARCPGESFAADHADDILHDFAARLWFLDLEVIRMKIRVRPDSVTCLRSLSVPLSSDAVALNHELLVGDAVILPEQLTQTQFVCIAGSLESTAACDSPEPLIDSFNNENAVSQSR